MTATVPRMADKGWTARVITAAGAAAGTGAAQLGLGYGLGVVVWPVATTPDESIWLGSLGWATWITASATVFGAVIGSRLGGPPPTRARGPWRFALAASAGLGALVAVALIALPARSAVRVETFSPQFVAAGYALMGVVFGVLVAYWAVLSRPVAANLMATAAWLWALAITAIGVELVLHRDSATYLTSWQFAEATAGGRYGTIYWPSAVLTVVASLLVGILTAVPATRRGDLGVGAATSGAVGPLLVAASFLVLAPRLTGALGPIESAYLIAPYAVLAGLAGSALTTASGQALANRRARRAAELTDEDRPALPAADPATLPTQAIPEKSKTPTGRAKPQPGSAASAQTAPATESSTRAGAASTPPSRSSSSSTPPAQASARSSSSTTPPARSGASAPPSPRSGSAPAQPGPAPRTAPSPEARPSAGPAGPTPVTPPVPASPTPITSPGPSNPPTPVNPPRSGPAPQPFADPEIAEAARGTGRRATKKTAPARKAQPQVKSTVTPPPDSPTIAQINPKPTARG